MSCPVKVTIQVTGSTGGSHSLTDYNKLTLNQHALTHHSFALDMSCEALGKALGLKPELVPTQAHEQLSGSSIAISWTSDRPGGAGRSFRFKGIITNISVETNADLVNYYHISGYSPTFLFEDGVQNRTFVKKSVQDIFTQVLSAYHHNALKKELKAQNRDVLAYTVQYHETTFNFLSRLAAHQGEWFYYDGETLRLGRGPSNTIAFHGSASQTFTLSMHLQPSKTEGASYNYRTHEPLKTSAVAPSADHAFGRFAQKKSDELFSQPHRMRAGTHVNDQAHLQRTVDLAVAKHAANRVSLLGRGEAFETVPGSVLDVHDAAGSGFGRFRVLAVEHEVDGDGNYSNHFEAMADAAVAPPPNPIYAATDAQPELAEVIDLADPKGLGRVRARFQWDVARAADAESCWLRVSTPYSGDGKGQLFTPEVGSQVLVGYEHGMAEFPVVLGNLFHPRNPQGAKYTTPNNQLKGLQTAGGNKVVMMDKPGSQTILLSNSNKKTTAVTVGFAGDGNVTIVTDGPVTVLGSVITLEAGKKGEIVMHAKNITMAAEEEVTIDSRSKNITLSAKMNITADATEKMELIAETASLTGRKNAGVLSPDTVDVGQGSTVNVSAGIINQS